jgi:hypothetical protein
MFEGDLRIASHILSRHADVLSIHLLFVVQNWAVLRLRCSTISALNYCHRLWQEGFGRGVPAVAAAVVEALTGMEAANVLNFLLEVGRRV